MTVDDATVTGQRLGQTLSFTLDAHLRGVGVGRLVGIIAVTGDRAPVDHLGRDHVDDCIVDFGHRGEKADLTKTDWLADKGTDAGVRLRIVGMGLEKRTADGTPDESLSEQRNGGSGQKTFEKVSGGRKRGWRRRNERRVRSQRLSITSNESTRKSRTASRANIAQLANGRLRLVTADRDPGVNNNNARQTAIKVDIGPRPASCAGVRAAGIKEVIMSTRPDRVYLPTTRPTPTRPRWQQRGREANHDDVTARTTTSRPAYRDPRSLATTDVVGVVVFCRCANNIIIFFFYNRRRHVDHSGGRATTPCT